MRCGTPSPIRGGTESLFPLSHCPYDGTTINSNYDPSHGIKYIPVVFHIIINPGDGRGNISDGVVRDQIAVLNEDFRAIHGSKGANGTDTMIQFYLTDTDPNGNPTNGITRYSNNGWWFQDINSPTNYWDSLSWDTDRYLNVYTNEPGPSGYYGPGAPEFYAGSPGDRVVVDWRFIGRNAPIGTYPWPWNTWNMGQLLTHEVGHYLGLYHTFENFTDPNNNCHPAASCYTNGDVICDTNPEDWNIATTNPPSGYQAACPTGQMNCGFLAPIHNYMNYTSHLCATEFTPEQTNRMRCTIATYRPNLPQNPLSCSAPLVAEETRILEVPEDDSVQDFVSGGAPAGAPQCGNPPNGIINPPPQGVVDLVVSAPRFLTPWGTTTTDLCCGSSLPLIGRYAGSGGAPGGILMATVTNLGPGWVNPGRVRINWEQRFTNYPVYSSSAIRQQSLAPGESVIVCTPFAAYYYGLIANSGGGVYRANVYVDANNTVAETNEAGTAEENNGATQDFCAW